METAGEMANHAETHVRNLLSAGFSADDIPCIANGLFEGVVSSQGKHACITPDARKLRQISMFNERTFRQDPRAYVGTILTRVQNTMRERIAS